MKISSKEELKVLCDIALNRQYAVMLSIPADFNRILEIKSGNDIKYLCKDHTDYTINIIDNQYTQQMIVGISVIDNKVNFNPLVSINYDQFILLYKELEFLRDVELI